MHSRTPPRGVSSPSQQSPLQDEETKQNSRQSRFTPQPFQYNGRVAVSLVPAVVVLLGAGGSPLFSTLIVGLTLSYILDAFQFKQGAFIGMWGSFFATAGACAFSGVGFSPHIPFWLSTSILLTCFHLIFLCGVWASIQFKWLQIEYPSVVTALERILFACCPITGVAMQTWGIIASIGIANSPFYMIPILFAHYWMFSLPRTSSFSSLKAEVGFYEKLNNSGASILTPMETCLHSILLLILPALYHFSIHHYMILRTANDLCDLLLLSFVPVILLLIGSTRGGLCWLTTDSRKLKRLRLINGMFALFVVLACVEVRVIFTSFSHYIHFPFPWNYILVSVAIYGASSAVALFFLSSPSPGIATAMISALMAAAAASAFVFGMPFYFFPAPLVCAVGLSLLLTARPNLLSHFLFMTGGVLSAYWFLHHYFGFLHASLAGYALPELSFLLVIALLLAMAVPASVLLPSATFITGLLLVGQAALLARVEEGLYAEEGTDSALVYPSYLVVVTTVAGVLVARRLHSAKNVASWALWLSCSFYIAKLSILLLPLSPVVQLHALALALALTLPLCIYDSKWFTSSRSPLPFLHSLILAVAVLVALPSIASSVAQFSHHTPPPTLVLAISILIWAVSSIPLLATHLLHDTSLRRAVILLLSLALLLFLLEPPVPSFISRFLAPETHPFDVDFDPDDLSIYSLASTLTTVHPYSDWLLIAAILASLAAATDPQSPLQAPLIGALYTASVSLALGMYLALHFFSRATALFPLILLALLCASFSVLLTWASAYSSPSSAATLTRPLFLLLLLLLPATWLLVPYCTKAVVEIAEAEEYYTHLAVEEIQTSVLALFCALLLLIAVAVKLRLSQGGKERLAGPNAQLPKHSPFAAKHRSVSHPGTFLKGLLSSSMASEASWLPAMGNIATLLCFGLALQLSQSNSEHHTPELTILALAAILLLLSHQGSLLAPLLDRQRYFPPAAAVTVYLGISTLWAVGSDLFYNYQFEGIHFENYGLLSAGRDLAFVAMALPNHAAFLKYVWDFAPQWEYFLLLFTPLTLPGLFLATSVPIRTLAGVGLGYAALQFVIARNVRIAGLKYI